LKDKINSLGGAARDIRFSIAGGNIFDETLMDIQNAVKDIAMGTLDGLTFGLSNVISALMGGGYIAFPKMWNDSDYSPPTVSYKIKAMPPYGNPISQIVDIDIVLASILALMLPRSTGQSSYTSPPLVRAFLRGKQNIELGMVTSCTITRGVNSVPYNKDGKTLGLEISLTISVLSEIMAAPTSPSIFGAYDISLDENNSLNRFLQTIAGRDYHTSRFIGKNALLNASRAHMGVQAATSPAFLGMLAGDTLFGRIAGMSFMDMSAVTLRDAK
jgi:hypothetical protein